MTLSKTRVTSWATCVVALIPFNYVFGARLRRPTSTPALGLVVVLANAPKILAESNLGYR